MASNTTNIDLHWKIIKMLHMGGQPVMYKVFTLGTQNKDISQNMQDYLDNLPPLSTANYPRATIGQRRFNATQVAKIRSNPSGSEWDISLLFPAIKLSCENVADINHPDWYTTGPKLENCVYVIKQKRNEAMHEVIVMTSTEFLNKARELRHLFNNTLKAAQQRYPQHFAPTDLAAQEQQVHNVIDEISNEVISLRDLQTYCGPMMLYDLQQECRAELTQKFSMMYNINPVSFIQSINLDLDVSLIFTDIEIKHERNTHVVSYRDLFVDVRRFLGKEHMGATVVLLEGLAGAGKTTLVRLMLKHWCDGSDSITDLDNFQVVLHVMCRDPSTDTYEKLLQRSLPHTSATYRSLLEPLLARCRILLLVDGFDEATQPIRQLLHDVLTQLHAADITIVCTSRPEQSHSFKELVTRLGISLKVTDTNIKGIPQSKRVEFIKKNHPQLKQQTDSGQTTDTVVQQLEELVKNEHYRLALNLILATWVCDQEPGVLKVNTTQTVLYNHILRLSWLKLKHRLSDHPDTRCMEKLIRDQKVEDWQPHLYEEQFLALSQDQVALPHEAVGRLRSACVTQQLPADEMLGAFLSLKSITPTVQQYTAPHKGIQEFYAALYVVRKIQSQQGAANIKAILEPVIGTDKKELVRYQNMFQHMIGLLHLHPDPVPDTITKEVVKLLHDTGVKYSEQWLDIIVEINASPTALAAIATHFDERCINVVDGRLQAYIQLLPHLPRARVTVNITGDLAQVVPALGNHDVIIQDSNVQLLPLLPLQTRVQINITGTLTEHIISALANHTVIIRDEDVDLLTRLPPTHVVAFIKREITSLDPILPQLLLHKYKALYLWDEFENPCNITPVTHTFLEKSVSWNQGLEEFGGQLSEIVAARMQHSHTLTILSLSLASDDQAAILTSLLTTLSHLKTLTIRLTPDVSPSALTALPDLKDSDGSSNVSLDLMNVGSDKVNWVLSMATTLKPSSSRYDAISLVGDNGLPKEEMGNIIIGLGQRNIKLDYFLVSVYNFLTDEHFEQKTALKNLTKASLGGIFGENDEFEINDCDDEFY